MSLLEKLQTWLQQQNTEVAFVNNPNHVAYFTGYESDPHERIFALIAFADQDPFLFVPGLEIADAKNSDWPYAVYGYQDHENPWAIIASEIKKRTKEPKKWAVEKVDLPLGRYEALQKAFPSAKFDTDLSPFIDELKLIKTPDEIQTMIEAGDWADFAFEIGFKAIQAGKTEQEITAEIEYELKKKGVLKMSFDTIVLTGQNGSSPHGIPGKTKVAKNDLVLFDLGVMWKGYASDATRTVAYGEPSPQAKEIYDIVLEAQLAATNAVKPGVTAEYLDKVARDIITKAGYGEYFTHRLGHGIGTSCHEFPSIMAGNQMTIKENMCFSIEPGIYVPGVAGVRIEDCIYVTKDGCKPFTKTPKTFTNVLK